MFFKVSWPVCAPMSVKCLCSCLEGYVYTSNFYKIQSPLREGLMPFQLHTHCPVLWLMYHRCSTHAYWNKHDTFPSTYNIPPYKGLNKMKGNSCLLFLSSLNQSFPFLFSLSLLNENNCYISGTRQPAECSKNSGYLILWLSCIWRVVFTFDLQYPFKDTVK